MTPDDSAEPGIADVAPAERQWADAWRRFRRNRLAVVGLGLIGVLVLAALFAELITTYEPNAIDVEARRQGPSAEHWFGTDQIGRDLFSRIVFGARVSLRVGIVSMLIATGIGVVVGSVAGYFGGWLDTLIMRITDVGLAFPYLLLAIAVVTVVGQSEEAVILTLGLLGWLAIARVLRSTILSIKEREFVEAARALGYGHGRIIARHILPNAIQPVIVYATLFTGAAVLSEAALSFLGAGVPAPKPSWGLMVNEGQRNFANSPHLLFFPGAAIFVMVVSFVFVGDGLRDALDPKLREGR